MKLGGSRLGIARPHATPFCKLSNEGDEDPFEAVRREFEEETSITPPTDRGAYLKLGTVQQSSSKRVAAWARGGNG